MGGLLSPIRTRSSGRTSPFLEGSLVSVMLEGRDRTYLSTAETIENITVAGQRRIRTGLRTYEPPETNGSDPTSVRTRQIPCHKDRGFVTHSTALSSGSFSWGRSRCASRC